MVHPGTRPPTTPTPPARFFLFHSTQRTALEFKIAYPSDGVNIVWLRNDSREFPESEVYIVLRNFTLPAHVLHDRCQILSPDK